MKIIVEDATIVFRRVGANTFEVIIDGVEIEKKRGHDKVYIGDQIQIKLPPLIRDTGTN